MREGHRHVGADVDDPHLGMVVPLSVELGQPITERFAVTEGFAASLGSMCSVDHLAKNVAPAMGTVLVSDRA